VAGILAGRQQDEPGVSERNMKALRQKPAEGSPGSVKSIVRGLSTDSKTTESRWLQVAEGQPLHGGPNFS
jgi:hypothetical protein